MIDLFFSKCLDTHLKEAPPASPPRPPTVQNETLVAFQVYHYWQKPHTLVFKGHDFVSFASGTTSIRNWESAILQHAKEMFC